jgi:hypothetical protein
MDTNGNVGRINNLTFGGLSGRLSCGHSETGQTNRLEMKPIRQRSQRPFPKSRDSTAVASAPISETDVHSAIITQFDTFNQT